MLIISKLRYDEATEQWNSTAELSKFSHTLGVVIEGLWNKHDMKVFQIYI